MSLPRLRRRYRVSKAPEGPSIQSSTARHPEVVDIASFLTLIVQADIHLFGQSFHSREHPSPAGAGATYAVSQSTLNFADLGFDVTDTYDDGSLMRGGEVSKGDILVTKRVGANRDDRNDKNTSYADVIRPLVQELRVLSHPPLRDHPNIIGLYGVAWEVHADWTGHCWPIVVLEYAGCGNLIDFFNLCDFDASWSMKLQFAHNVVEALTALHQSGIIHGDLKAENVLVTRNLDRRFQLKLCDFGFAIIKSDYKKGITQIPIWGFTPRWAAPELRHGNISLDLAESVDTYSFGLLFALILNEGQSPHLVDGRELDLEDIQSRQDRDEIADIVVQNVCVGDNTESQLVKAVLRGTLVSDPGMRLGLERARSTLVELSSSIPGESLMELDSNEDTDDASTEPSIISTQSETDRLRPIFEEQDDDLFLPEPSNLERLFDLPVPAQNELRQELEIRAKQKASTPNMLQTEFHRKSVHYAAHLLSVLLLDNLVEHQYQGEAMHWLLQAAQAGSTQARLDILRVSCASNYQYPLDVQDLLRSWLRASTISGPERFALDTIQRIDPTSLDQINDEARKNWMFRLSSSVKGETWQLAIFNAINEYISFYRINLDSLPTKSTPLEGIAAHIKESSAKFLDFIISRDSDTGSIRALRDYGYGLTWIHFAAFLSLTEFFTKFQHDSQTLNVRDAFGRTPLFFATFCGNSEMATLLLAAGAAAALGHDEKGNTCLHFAFLFRHEEIPAMIERLVKNGADINAKNLKGETPLHKTLQSTISSRSNYATVSALLQQGADPCLEDTDDEPPHFWAVMITQTSSLKLLMDASRTILPTDSYSLFKANLLDRLMSTSQYERLVFGGPDYPACLEEMLRLLADENTMQVYKTIEAGGGDSVFFAAALRRATDVMDLLIKIYPDIEINEPEFEFGRPAIFYAIRHSKQSILDYLLDLGADIFVQDSMHETTLHHAAEFSPDMLDQLLKICQKQGRLKEMIDTESIFGLTAFDNAVINGHLKAACKLLENGAKSNGYRCHGANGMRISILGYLLQMPRASLEQVQYLVNLGAEAIISQDNSTVFHAFATRSVQLQDEVIVEFDGESSKMPIFYLLLHSFPKAIHLTNAAKETPLHVASRAARLDIINRLIEVGIDINAVDGDGKTAYERIMAQKEVGLDGDFDQRYLLPRKRYMQEVDKITNILQPLSS